MGRYTDNFELYLTDDTDLVDVDSDVNYNLERLDAVLKPLIQYQLTDVPVITTSDLPKEVGYKFYKWHSNSVWFCATAGAPVQDGNAQVDSWNTGFGSFASGYSNYDESTNRIAYSSHNGWISWRGKLARSGRAAFVDDDIIFPITLSPSVLPNSPKYFMCAGGFTTAAPQIFRVYIPSSDAADKRMKVIKYRGIASDSDERYLCLNQIRYPLDDSLP